MMAHNPYLFFISKPMVLRLLLRIPKFGQGNSRFCSLVGRALPFIHNYFIFIVLTQRH